MEFYQNFKVTPPLKKKKEKFLFSFRNSFTGDLLSLFIELKSGRNIDSGVVNGYHFPTKKKKDIINVTGTCNSGN